MISFIARAIVTLVALTSLQYSSVLEHVDVAVPGACIPQVSAKAEAVGGECVYRDATRRGNLVAQDFAVVGPSGASFETPHARIVGGMNSSGFTWRTFVLVFVAMVVWVPSILPRAGAKTVQKGEDAR